MGEHIVLGHAVIRTPAAFVNEREQLRFSLRCGKIIEYEVCEEQFGQGTNCSSSFVGEERGTEVSIEGCIQ